MGKASDQHDGARREKEQHTIFSLSSQREQVNKLCWLYSTDTKKQPRPSPFKGELPITLHSYEQEGRQIKAKNAMPK